MTSETFGGALMIVYRIANWGKYYENYRTRELKKMEWVPMPNKFDGDGYTALVNHKNGAAHFGAWCALVELASRCKNDVGSISVEGAGKHRDSAKYDSSAYPHGRGILIRENGEAHDPISFQRITRIPISVWEEVLPRLVSIGWIETYETNRQDIGTSSVLNRCSIGTASVGGTDGVPTDYPMNGMEGNGTEGKEDTLSGDQESPDPAVAYFLQQKGREDRHVPVKAIIDYFNERCMTSFNPDADYAKRILKARWNEGYRFEDFKAVIDVKSVQWLTDPKMIRYLRPLTLFAASKFDSYLNEAHNQASKKLAVCPSCGMKDGLHAESCPQLNGNKKEQFLDSKRCGDPVPPALAGTEMPAFE